MVGQLQSSAYFSWKKNTMGGFYTVLEIQNSVDHDSPKLKINQGNGQEAPDNGGVIHNGRVVYCVEKW